MRPYLKNTQHTKRAGGVAQGIGPEFKPQYRKKMKRCSFESYLHFFKAPIFSTTGKLNLTGVTIPDFAVINGKFSTCLNHSSNDLYNGPSELLLQSITFVMKNLLLFTTNLQRIWQTRGDKTFLSPFPYSLNIL
jgi:hypothetical protein